MIIGDLVAKQASFRINVDKFSKESWVVGELFHSNEQLAIVQILVNATDRKRIEHSLVCWLRE